MGMDDGVTFDGLQHELFSNPRAYETFELFVNACGSEQQLTIEWSYNTQLFTPATIRAMMRAFEDLIRTIMQNPVVRLHEITIPDVYTTPGIIRQLPRKNAYTSYPKEKSVHQLISEKARERSDETALYFEKQIITYRQLNETANQLAAVLLQNNVQPGDIIGIALERSHEMVVAILAIMKSGAAYLPLDPEYPKDRIEFMLADSSPKLVLISKKFQGTFYTNTNEIVIEDVWPELKKNSKKDPLVSVNGNDIVYILYTSGSTGKPKGVRIAHHNLSNFLFSLQKTLSINQYDKFLGLTTLSFDISGLEIFLPLISGASVAIVSSQTAKDGNLLLQAVRKIQPTVMQATPATWQMLLEAGWNESMFIKTVCSGGEALTRELATKLNKRSKNVYNLYGPTETTIWSAVKKVDLKDEQITIGHPIDNTDIYILDNSMIPVPPNSVGEIYIAGEGVAKGYLKRPVLTRERFVNNPFSDKQEDKMYRTGDLGRILANGEIECIGRADHQIKIRGYRIEPGEVEHCLMQENDVKTCVVIGREDRPGDQRLVAYVVTQPVSDHKVQMKAGKIVKIHGYTKDASGNKHSDSVAASSPEDQIERWKQVLRRALPAYMMPNDFVILKSLPLTPNGKIDRKALPVPDAKERFAKKYKAPTTNLEASLVEMWKKLLRIPQVGIDDNFFEVGGHSLLAMRLISLLREEMSVEIPLIDIFQTTVRSLALKIKELQDRDTRAQEKLNSVPDNSLQPKVASALGRKFEASQLEWGSAENGKYLIPIQEGGVKIAMFGIISFYSYRLLANYMSKDQPLLYLPPTRSASVETIASHFVKEIKSKQPLGPYCVAGFCTGGAVALEIAQQLQAQGDTVSALILFEFYSPHAVISKRSLKYIKRKVRYYQDRIRYFRSIGSPVKAIQAMIRNYYERIKDSYLEPPPPKFITSKHFNKYVFKPYAGKVILFKAVNPPLEIGDSPLMGWSDYFEGNVEQITVDGGHLGIFREPAIQDLAKKLSVVLEGLNNPAQPNVVVLKDFRDTSSNHGTYTL
jgi:amino acid adenylation domain-containing protein